MTRLSKRIARYSPCDEAVEWLDSKPSAAVAWRKCRRGDWMLWLLGNLSGPPGSASRKKLVLCACACARLSLKHVPKGEKRPRIAIETAERWARGDASVTLDDVRHAASAASAAADAASTASAAAYAASAASAAASAAADAAADAAGTASAASVAADAANGREWKKTNQRCAAIVLDYYPTAPRIPRSKK